MVEFVSVESLQTQDDAIGIVRQVSDTMSLAERLVVDLEVVLDGEQVLDVACASALEPSRRRRPYDW